MAEGDCCQRPRDRHIMHRSPKEDEGWTPQTNSPQRTNDTTETHPPESRRHHRPNRRTAKIRSTVSTRRRLRLRRHNTRPKPKVRLPRVPTGFPICRTLRRPLRTRRRDGDWLLQTTTRRRQVASTRSNGRGAKEYAILSGKAGREGERRNRETRSGAFGTELRQDTKSQPDTSNRERDQYSY